MKVHYIQLYMSSLLFPLIIAKKKRRRAGKEGQREGGKGKGERKKEGKKQF